jgi:hypothetical protein
MKLWLTQCHDGKCVLTGFKPVIARVRGPNHMDVYEVIGEPMTVKGLCPFGVTAIFGSVPEPLTPREVEIEGRYI